MTSCSIPGDQLGTISFHKANNCGSVGLMKYSQYLLLHKTGWEIAWYEIVWQLEERLLYHFIQCSEYCGTNQMIPLVFVATFGYYGIFLDILMYIRDFLGTFEYLWVLLSTFGNFCPFLVCSICDKIRLHVLAMLHLFCLINWIFEPMIYFLVSTRPQGDSHSLKLSEASIL